MTLRRARSVEEMLPARRDPDDPANLRVVGQMMDIWFRMSPKTRTPGVRRFRDIREADEGNGDPYGSENPELIALWETATGGRWPGS